jgi:hypothetical protein
LVLEGGGRGEEEEERGGGEGGRRRRGEGEGEGEREQGFIQRAPPRLADNLLGLPRPLFLLLQPLGNLEKDITPCNVTLAVEGGGQNLRQK